MPKISKGDMIDAKVWDGLVITKVKDRGVNVDRKAFGCSRIPDYFSYKDIDGWSNGEVSLHYHGFGIWLGYVVETGEEFQCHAEGLIDAINVYNEGLAWFN